MKILFDITATQPTTNSKIHGGGEYGKAVFYKLLNTLNNQELYCVYFSNVNMDENISSEIKKRNIKIFSITNRSEMSEILKENMIDIFYSAMPYNYYNLNKGKTKIIFTIHGLRQLEVFSDRYELLYAKSLKDYVKYFKKLILKSKSLLQQYDKYNKLLNVVDKDIIIVPSKHTKYSLLSFFPQHKDKDIRVLYSPTKEIELKAIDEKQLLNKYKVQNKLYFLLINGDRWIKNNYRMVLALDSLYSQFDIQIKTLILGVTNMKVYKNLKNKDKFILFDYVSDEDLEILQKNAYAFLYPTLNEGFGLPPINSMKYGVPVIASANSSVTEVCKDSVLYFNSYLIKEMEIRLLNLIEDKDTYCELSKRGRKRYELLNKEQEIMLDKLVEIILN